MDITRLSTKWTMVVTALLLALSAVLLVNLEKNTSAFFLPAEHPARVAHSEHKEAFTRAGYSTFILLRLRQDADIYRNDLVEALESMHKNLLPIDLIQSLPFDQIKREFAIEEDISAYDKDALVDLYNELSRLQSRASVQQLFGQYLFPIKTVKSLINTDNIYLTGDELLIEPSFLVQEEWSKENIESISQNQLLSGALFSDDQQGVIVQVEFSVNEEDTELNLALLEKIKSAVDISLQPYPVIESVHYAGGPVLNNALSVVMEKDNATYFPLVILFVLTALTLFYRSILCAVYGLTISVLSIVFTMALMPLFGVTLNIVTTVLPVFIITIAVTDAIHLMSDVKTSEQATNELAIRFAIKKLLRPMFLTSITTGIGFLSLSLTEIDNIQGFGFMVAISVVIAFVLSVTILPALLRLKPIGSASASSNQAGDSRTSRVIEFVTNLATKRAWPAVICGVITLSLTLYGLPKLEVNQASIEAFDPDSSIQLDNDAFEESGTGSVVMNIWFSGSEDSAVLRPEVLSLVRSVQNELKQHPVYVDSTSIIDFLDRTDSVLEGRNEIDLSDAELVRQYLFLLEGGAERDLDSVVSSGDYSQTRIAVSLDSDNSAAASEIVRVVERVAQDALPDGITIRYSGYAAITLATADEVFKSQLNSLISSIAAILLVFIFVFRSLTTALIGMIPLTATLATMFGVMGTFAFPLDVGSSLVAGIAFGIGIDYAIHLIEAVRRSARNSALDRDAVIGMALKQVVMPISVSALVLSSGFSLLLLSGFKSLASLGLLVVVSMLVSAVFSLFIVPQILRVLPLPLFRFVALSGQVEGGDLSDDSLDDFIVVDKKNELVNHSQSEYESRSEKSRDRIS